MIIYMTIGAAQCVVLYGQLSYIIVVIHGGEAQLNPVMSTKAGKQPGDM